MIEIIFWSWLAGGCATAGAFGISMNVPDTRGDAIWWIVFWPFFLCMAAAAIVRGLITDLIQGWYL